MSTGTELTSPPKNNCLNDEDPYSLVRVAPPEFSRAMRQVEDKDWGITEDQFLKHYPRVESFVNIVRIEFWREYDTAQGQQCRMSLSQIMTRVGASRRQIERLLEHEPNLIWILIPPETYEATLEESVSHGIKRLRKMLDAPIFNADGELMPKAGELLLKTVAFLDMRKNGGIVNKNLHIVSRQDAKQLSGTPRSIEDINKRIAELEAKGITDRVLGIANPGVEVYGPNGVLEGVVPPAGTATIKSND